MAAFELSKVDDQQLDWVILRQGGVALYWRPEILSDDLKWFQAKNYVIHRFDAAEWDSEDPMHDALMQALNFPDWYGKNPNALRDCIEEDLVIPDDTGLALVFYHFDHFVKVLGAPPPPADMGYAEITLHILARAIRHHSLLGKRMVVLVQSDDPKLRFGPLGGIHPIWNWREWMSRDRRL